MIDKPLDYLEMLPDSPPEDFTMVEIEFESEVAPPEDDIRLSDVPHGANLAGHIEESELSLMASELLANIDADISSREEWEKGLADGIKLLGLTEEKKSMPWPGACSLVSTMVPEAVVRFQSNAIMEIFPPAGPVKTKIIGRITREKMDQSERVADRMNYCLTEQIKSYRPETEKLLFGLGFSGSAFRKMYDNPVLERPDADYVPAQDFIMPYGTKNLESAERYTHRMTMTVNQIKRLQAVGQYCDCDLQGGMVNQTELEQKVDKIEQRTPAYQNADSLRVYESHVDLVIEGDSDDVALPYIFTVTEDGVVLGLYRNWREDDPKKTRIPYFSQYTYIPGFGAYGYGVVHLIGGSAKAQTMLQQQLIDAGTLANLPAGLKAKGLRMKGDDDPIRPGEFREAEVLEGKLADKFFMLPYKEPSTVLLELMKMVADDGRRLGSIADVEIGDVSAQAPVGTTMMIMERALKVMSAVQARLHASMAEEFKILARIIKDNTPEEYEYEVEGGERIIKKADFDDRIDIIPVSDPNAATMSQRITLYQTAIQLSQQAPQLYDLGKLHREILRVIGMKDVDQIVPDKGDIKPADPVVENMSMVNQKPVKAFEWQDHEAHLAVHTAFRQDPQLAAMMGQNPQANAIFGAMMAHECEHLAFKYRNQMEEELGVPLPAIEDPLPGDLESMLSVAIAKAAGQLLDKHKKQAAAEEAAAKAEDPIIQMQQAELKIKEAAVQQKAAQVQTEAQVELQKATEQQATERMRIQSQAVMAQEAAIDKNEAFLAELKLDRQRQADLEKLHSAQIAEILARIDGMQNGGQDAAK